MKGIALGVHLGPKPTPSPTPTPSFVVGSLDFSFADLSGLLALLLEDF